MFGFHITLRRTHISLSWEDWRGFGWYVGVRFNPPHFFRGRLPF